jgi:hypothetical protein
MTKIAHKPVSVIRSKLMIVPALLLALMASRSFAVSPNTPELLKASEKNIEHSFVESRPDRIRNRQSSGQSDSNKAKVATKQGDIVISRRTQTKVARTLSLFQETAKKTSKLRAENPAIALNHTGYSIYDVVAYLNIDSDNDGFYSDFSLDIDADIDGGSANVYAIVYTSQNGAAWEELYVTDVFSIIDSTADDIFSVTTTLNFGYPSSEYDLLVDLYIDGVAGIVATLEPNDDSDLLGLPLEDVEHEALSNLISIDYVATDLSGDVDADGFYTALTLEYDLNTSYAGDTVYAEVVLTNTVEGWQQVLSTDNFVLGNQTEFIDLTFNSGYTAGWYDVEIHIINAYSDELIADAAQEFQSLVALPIESLNNDDVFDVPRTTANDIDVIVVGGGSMGWGVLSLAFIGLRRRCNGKIK